MRALGSQTGSPEKPGPSKNVCLRVLKGHPDRGPRLQCASGVCPSAGCGPSWWGLTLGLPQEAVGTLVKLTDQLPAFTSQLYCVPTVGPQVCKLTSEHFNFLTCEMGCCEDWVQRAPASGTGCALAKHQQRVHKRGSAPSGHLPLPRSEAPIGDRTKRGGRRRGMPAELRVCSGQKGPSHTPASASVHLWLWVKGAGLSVCGLQNDQFVPSGRSSQERQPWPTFLVLPGVSSSGSDI